MQSQTKRLLNFAKFAESHFVKYAHEKYAESQSRSDCCAITVAKRLLPHFVKYAESHLVKYAQPQSRSDWYIPFENMQSRSREATVAQSQSRSDCYPL